MVASSRIRRNGATAANARERSRLASMDSPDWLRTQLTSFTCPACGRRYRGSRIRFLAERDGLFFVDLDCARCGSHTVAIVTVELDDTEPSIIDVSTSSSTSTSARAPGRGAAGSLASW